MPFQTSINQFPAPAVEGDFASDNTRTSVLNAVETLLAAAAGVTVGRFSWVDSPSQTASNAGSGVPDGFVHRQYGAMITQWLGQAGMVIPQGVQLSLLNQGDFWAKTLTTATVGQKVYAVLADGTIKTGAAGGSIAGAVETKWSVASAGAVGELIKITSWK